MPCGTHHFACDCREAQFKVLVDAAERVIGHYSIVHKESQFPLRTAGQVLLGDLEKALEPFRRVIT